MSKFMDIIHDMTNSEDDLSENKFYGKINKILNKLNKLTIKNDNL